MQSSGSAQWAHSAQWFSTIGTPDQWCGGREGLLHISPLPLPALFSSHFLLNKQRCITFTTPTMLSLYHLSHSHSAWPALFWRSKGASPLPLWLFSYSHFTSPTPRKGQLLSSSHSREAKVHHHSHCYCPFFYSSHFSTNTKIISFYKDHHSHSGQRCSTVAGEPFSRSISSSFSYKRSHTPNFPAPTPRKYS